MKIPVTKSFLPPLDEYMKYLSEIWASGILTNNGPMVTTLETKLKEYLGVKHLFFVTNGTIALQIAVKALELCGEVITTPFSYVATTSSLVWEGCTPVFVDIDPRTLCLDPNRVEAAITPRTTAILATHVYGIPCDVEQIQAIAARHNLKVVYDAAHAFGVRYRGKALSGYGNLSTLSFHATKLFHTIEGGAVVTDDDEIAHRLSYMRNFGHKGQEDFWGLGINGKNSEFHAAMGLCNLPYIREIISARAQVCAWYDEELTGSGLIRPQLPDRTEYNFAYYPVLLPSEEVLLRVHGSLNAQQIFPRRYFHPSLDQLPYSQAQAVFIAHDAARRVLCLPLFHALSFEEIQRISSIIVSTLNG